MKSKPAVEISADTTRAEKRESKRRRRMTVHGKGVFTVRDVIVRKAGKIRKKATKK